jgi:hypothetical protein
MKEIKLNYFAAYSRLGGGSWGSVRVAQVVEEVVVKFNINLVTIYKV